MERDQRPNRIHRKRTQLQPTHPIQRQCHLQRKKPILHLPRTRNRIPKPLPTTRKTAHNAPNPNKNNQTIQHNQHQRNNPHRSPHTQHRTQHIKRRHNIPTRNPDRGIHPTYPKL